MCGISGIVKFDPRGVVEESRLRAMSDSLWHRGPDDGGLVLDGQVGLAHRRLSIIDLAHGKQPMANGEPGDTWISYNGELYNFRELRTQLQSLGCHFTTQSDTEVVLRAYEVYGEDCVNVLRGMFAFAIWDGKQQRLLLVRDRLGIKPLYFSATEGELLFGSEIKALLRAGSIRPVFNSAVLPEYLATRYVSGRETFFEGIYKVLPGHMLTWSPQEGMQEKRYWQLPAEQEDTGLSRKDYVEMVRSGLQDAVRSHLVSDVPVGLFLSGGIDSSVLGSLMASMSDEPIHSFSVGFAEQHANELEYAALAARSIGARHNQVTVSAQQFFATLPQLIWHEDEPIAFTSSVPLHEISRLASQHLKVVLTGEGADELFLGYDYRYRVTHWNHRLGGWYSGIVPEQARDALAGLVPRLPGSMRRYAERTFLAMENNPRALFFENFSVFRSEQRKALLRDPERFADRDPHAVGLRHYHAAGSNRLQCMSHADIQTYLVELLMKQDQMSMSASLESRVPFLDHRLVETVASIPGRYKMRGWQTKSLLRDAVRDLIPEEILMRKKMGFPVPTSQWLRGPYWSLVEEFVLGARARARGHFNPDALDRLAREHRSGQYDHGERLWLLINLEMWQRIFIDGENPAQILPGFNQMEEKAA